MRTKTLLLTAALGAAGIATSMAQVYSVNAVGYVNTDLQTGFNLISNPLNNTAGNTIANLFGTGWNGPVPNGTVVYFYTGTTFVIASYEAAFGEFDPPASAAQVVRPGEGVFLNVPAAAGAQRVTFVGEVPQGPASNIEVPAGFSIRASTVPAAGPINGAAPGLNFPATDGDTVYEWSPATDSYTISSFVTAFGGWDPQVPDIAVGEAFWINNVGGATQWTRNFSVNP